MSPSKNKQTFTAEEKAAMRAAAAERRRKQTPAEAEAEVEEKIAEMSGPDRAIAERLHAIIKENAPELAPRTWYGMPAYAKDGNVVCFFQPAEKFKARYGTFGFNDRANLDKGSMWPTAFALKKLTKTDEKKIAALIRQAVS
jgi:uncharacterized protein YdhG (YjbR/CyaY superfamily)